jgi:hypothetical protein
MPAGALDRDEVAGAEVGDAGVVERTHALSVAVLFLKLERESAVVVNDRCDPLDYAVSATITWASDERWAVE